MSDTALEAGASASGSRHTVDPGRPEHPSGDDRFALVDTHLRRVHDAQDQLIETLHVAQDVFGFLSDDVLLYVARALRLPPSMVYGVATFYHLFTFEPPGEHTCTVCTGTACFVKGADDIVADVATAHGVHVGDTSADGRLTLRTARCLGSCGLAPVVVLDGVVHGHQSPSGALALLDGELGGVR
ncbi:MAG: bidirectional hydrogenase complex protein HoxE [Ilumatobacteraceae bacterium]|nr:bidirectional hydrogenase complex protein HoxE [Acidimicrobiales bacterium]MCB9394568.1 bidirectional hydrogenase complex protein HoxE [Acidimicrobiaceae bacterium]